MKKLLFLSFFFLLTSVLIIAQSADPEHVAKAKETKSAFLKSDSGMSSFFNTCYAYVIFPNIGKGAVVVGGVGVVDFSILGILTIEFSILEILTICFFIYFSGCLIFGNETL